MEPQNNVGWIIYALSYIPIMAYLMISDGCASVKTCRDVCAPGEACIVVCKERWEEK
jgi:hypothetical protein